MATSAPEERAIQAVEEPTLHHVLTMDDPLAHTNVSQPAVNTSQKGSIERDLTLAKIEKERKLSFIKAWRESEKSRAQNKARKKLSEIASWENTKQAALEAQLRKFEEKMEKKKAEYAEKMKNKVALVHRQAEEKRATVEAIRGEDMLMADEKSAKYQATGRTPRKGFGCF